MAANENGMSAIENSMTATENPSQNRIDRVEATSPVEAETTVTERFQTEANQELKALIVEFSKTEDPAVTMLFGSCSIECDETNGKTEAGDRHEDAADDTAHATEKNTLREFNDKVNQSAPDAALERILSPHAKSHEDLQGVAAEFHQRGQDALREALKELSVTADGAPATVRDYREKFLVSESKSTSELAREQVGSNATDEQVKVFERQLLHLNGKMEPTIFAEGSVIRMPGQTADGGIVSKKAGITATEWSDGSRTEIAESGRGSVYAFNSAGDSIETSWDARNLGGNVVMMIGADKMITVTAVGDRIEQVFIADAGPDGNGSYETTSITSKDEQGRNLVQHFEPGELAPYKITVVDAERTIEFSPDAEGEFRSPDGNFGLQAEKLLYTRVPEANGGETKIFGDGNWQTEDADGVVIKSGGKDDWGREAEYEYTGDSINPTKTTIDMGNGTRVVLEYNADENVHRGHELDGDGNRIRAVEQGEDGRLIFDDGNGAKTATLKDGTTYTEKTHEDGSSTVTYEKDGEAYSEQYDKDEYKTADVFKSKDGRIFTMRFDNQGEDLTLLKFESPDGSLTELNVDEHNDTANGYRVDKLGKVVDSVSIHEDKFLYRNLMTGELRAEKYVKGVGESGMPKFVPGEFSADAGTFTYLNSTGLRTVEPVFTGRTDVFHPDGSVVGDTISGDQSSVTADGIATVLHDDETGVRLNADRTIDRWNTSEGEGHYGESLTLHESKFLDAHPAVDRREIAEVHRRLGGDTAKLDRFYEKLATIASANNLTDTQRATLQKNIIHHVAYPGEIYQGASPSCNSAVVQRELVMTRPDLYVEHVVNSISKGFIATADGAKVALDPENLKMADESGRDLASRIFQTAALSAHFHPRAVFLNTADGAGQVVTKPDSAESKSGTFDGLNLAQIASLRFKLTGEEKAVTLVENLDELRTAFELNGGAPMIIGVDATKSPFEGNGPVGSGDGINHVVTLVGLTLDRAYVQNQWGLENDRSSSRTALDPELLIQNMTAQSLSDKPGKAIVISAGHHELAFQIENGKSVIDHNLSTTIKEGVEMMPEMQ